MPEDMEKRVIKETRRVMTAAKAEGSLAEMSRRDLIIKVAEAFDLAEGDMKPYKQAIKDTIAAEMAAETQAEDQEAPSPKRKRSPSPTKAEASKRKKTDTSSPATEAASSPSSSKTKVEPQVSKADEKQEEDHKSESEMSVLIDEPPKRRKGSKKDKSVANAKPRKSKEKPTLSKSEEEVKKLKSLIVACGVRKQWAREHKDMSENQRIQHLKKLLVELGMTGKMSLEKAKSIRTKRELQAEIADVVQFEKAKGVNSVQRRNQPRNSESSSNPLDSDDEEGDDRSGGSESDEESSKESVKKGTTKPKGGTARRSIMAFLGDQSDSE